MVLPFVALTVALSLGSPATAGAETAAGQKAYERRCAKCHETPARLLRRMPERTAEERRQWLANVLRTHHARDEETRNQIIEWLLAR
ncbi:MAG: hypothetical protein Tsb0019_20450 [Roseibium sp.]